MSPNRNPLVLVPQHFGSLVFDRRASRYLPFDAEATRLLLALRGRPLHEVLRDLPGGGDRAILDFYDCFYRLGFFRPDGLLAADLLDVDPPADHLVGPLAVHLEIVAACNLACTHCFAGLLPRHDRPLTSTELDRLFHDLAGLGSFRLGLTGGEPLLRKDLFDVVDAAAARGLHPCLTTNGLLLTEPLAREFGKRELVWLNVSLEGPDAATNDAVRGAGTFDRVLDGLRLLRRHARFTLAFTVLRTNAHLVRRCAALAHEVGAHTAVFRPLYPVGVARDHLDLMPTFAQYTEALADLATLALPAADVCGLDPFSPATREAGQARIHTNPVCGAGTHVCSVSVHGDVNPCSFLGPGFNAGNVRDQPFAAIWRNSQTLRRLRQASDDSEGFQGGCRARAQTFAGSAFAADPWYEEHRRGPGPHPNRNLDVSARRPLPLLQE